MNDKEILIKAFKILAKRGGYPHYNCKEHAFNCYQCQFQRFMDDFLSLLTFYFDDLNIKDTDLVEEIPKLKGTREQLDNIKIRCDH